MNTYEVVWEWGTYKGYPKIKAHSPEEAVAIVENQLEIAKSLGIHCERHGFKEDAIKVSLAK